MTRSVREKYEEPKRNFAPPWPLIPRSTSARDSPSPSLFEQDKSAESSREFESVRRAVGDQPGISYYLGRLGLDDRNYPRAAESLKIVCANQCCASRLRIPVRTLVSAEYCLTHCHLESTLRKCDCYIVPHLSLNGA
jgi:hypothetical protein